MPEELVGVFQKERVRFESNYMIGVLKNQQIIVGNAMPGDLVPGLEYVFIGETKSHPKYGPQFKFQGFTQLEPKSRAGVVEYLKRFDKVSVVRINQMADVEGHDRVLENLRTDPAGVAYRSFHGKPGYLDLVVKIDELSQALRHDGKFQETKVQLLELFAGRGFPHTLPDACIKKFGALAARRVRRDPFSMMIAKLPGCGFLRVDRLYCELGLPQDRMRRQIMCAWHYIHSDEPGKGTTWHDWEVVARMVAQRLTGNVRVERALKAGVRAKWLTTRIMRGKLWIADRVRAANEEILTKKMKELR